MKEYKLDFKVCYIEKNKSFLPKEAGIYCVYTCKYNEVKNSVSDLFLIYIGESENIYERHRDNSHEHYEDFESYLGEGETLCYSFALVPNENDRKRCEAALIYEMQPPINEQSTESFSYPKTHIIITDGENFGLNEDFTVGE